MKTKKQIIFILPELRFGGIQIFALDLAFYQLQKGHKVKIFTFTKNTSVLSRYNRKKKSSLKKIITVINISHLYLYLIKRIASKNQVIIHSQGSVLTSIGFFALFKNIKIIHTVQNQAEYEAGKKRMKIHSFYFKYTNVLAVANSKEISNSFLNYYGYRPHAIIYNGLDLDNNTKKEIDIDKLSNTKDSIKILTVGTLGESKNQKMLIDAFLKLDYRGTSLLIIGANPNNYIEEEYIDSLKSKNIFYFGQVQDSVSYMEVCNIFCMSSRNEGLPLVLMEAKLKNMTVITTRVGGSEEIIDSHDYSVPPNDLDGYVAALRNAIISFKNDSIRVKNPTQKRFLEISRCYSDYYNLYKN